MPVDLEKVTRDYSTKDIADYFLAQVDEEAGDSLSNLKLQKLLYYAQGAFLAIHHRPLFEDRIEAWEHGPVVPTLYRGLNHHGADPVPLERPIDLAAYEPAVRDLLDEVYLVYGQFSASKLRDMTREEAPCKNTPRGEEIDLAAMREYFSTQLVES